MNKRHGHDDQEHTPEDDDDERQTRDDDYNNTEMRKKCIIDAYTNSPHVEAASLAAASQGDEERRVKCFIRET